MDKNKSSPPNKISVIKKFLEVIPLDYLFAALCTGFCFSSFCTLLSDKDSNISYLELSFSTSVNLGLVIITTLIIFIALIFAVLIMKSKKIIPAMLIVSVIIFGSALAYNGTHSNEEGAKNIYMNIAIGFVLFFVSAWVCKDDKLNLLNIKLPKHTSWIVAGVLLIGFTIVVSVASIARYNAYLPHNFDLGIFTQMFENMRTTGVPDTTVERNVLMSHFGVHFSPFYYVALPLYMIYPHPEMVLIIQALFVALGIIPVVLICKKMDFSETVTIMFSIMYIFYPTLSNGCLYDFHENKFLTMLIMWTLYFIISENWIGTLIFSILTLTVKEDSAIYIIAIALYILISRKKYFFGGTLLLISFAYFVFATNMVSSFNVLGEGIMTGRLENYMPEGSAEGGFGSVVKTCLSNFGYFLSQVFTADKIMFMVWMLLPVAFAPFFSKDKSIFLLLVPMLVVDLMSNWQYQYDVKFQYTYGVAGLVVFIAIVVFSAFKDDSKKQNHLMLYSLSMSIIMCFSLFFPRSSEYIRYDKSVKDTTQGYNELIAEIPTDAQITADGYYIPHLYNFKNLYQYPNYYGDNIKSEYMLVNVNNVSNNSDGLADFMGNDYELIKQSGNMGLYKTK